MWKCIWNSWRAFGSTYDFLIEFYDGKNFTNYPLWKAPVYGIDQESVIPLQYLDADGRIWLKEKGNLKIFDLDKGEFIQPDTLLAGWGVKKDFKCVHWFQSSCLAGDGIFACTPLWYKEPSVADHGRRPAISEWNGTLMAVESYGSVSWILHEMACCVPMTGIRRNLSDRKLSCRIVWRPTSR